VQKFVQELDASSTTNEAVPGVLKAGAAGDDPSWQQLRDNIRRLRGAALGVNGVDSTFAAYARCREQSLELCKALVRKASQLFLPVAFLGGDCCSSRFRVACVSFFLSFFICIRSTSVLRRSLGRVATGTAQDSGWLSVFQVA
jgi:hypothetical protein